MQCSVMLGNSTHMCAPFVCRVQDVDGQPGFLTLFSMYCEANGWTGPQEVNADMFELCVERCSSVQEGPLRGVATLTYCLRFAVTTCNTSIVAS